MKIWNAAVLSSLVTVGLLSSACGSDKKAGDDEDGGSGGGSVLGGGTGGTSDTGGTGGSNGGTTGGTGTGGSSGGTTGGTGTGGSSTGGTGGGKAGTSGTTGGAGGTSASGGSAGVPMGVGDCDEGCQKLLDAQCGGDLATCVTNCNALSSVCSAESAAFMACTIEPTSTVTCGDEGPIVSACDAENLDLSVCLACQAMTTDTECLSCSRSSCCGEIETYLRSSDVLAFEECIGACADATCAEACRAASPVASAADEAIGECQNDSCAEPCICGPRDTDTACLTCAKTNCCEELLPYALASDVEGFSACLDTCEDQACADACIADYEVAGPAFQTYSDCALAACPTQCGGT